MGRSRARSASIAARVRDSTNGWASARSPTVANTSAALPALTSAMTQSAQAANLSSTRRPRSCSAQLPGTPARGSPCHSAIAVRNRSNCSPAGAFRAAATKPRNRCRSTWSRPAVSRYPPDSYAIRTGSPVPARTPRSRVTWLPSVLAAWPGARSPQTRSTSVPTGTTCPTSISRAASNARRRGSVSGSATPSTQTLTAPSSRNCVCVHRHPPLSDRQASARRRTTAEPQPSADSLSLRRADRPATKHQPEQGIGADLSRQAAAHIP